METPDGGREAPLHRRSQEATRPAHEGPPRLQVPPPQEAQDPEEGRLPLQHPLPCSLHGPPARRCVFAAVSPGGLGRFLF